jgi:hypothetical protein
MMTSNRVQLKQKTKKCRRENFSHHKVGRGCERFLQMFISFCLKFTSVDAKSIICLLVNALLTYDARSADTIHYVVWKCALNERKIYARHTNRN